MRKIKNNARKILNKDLNIYLSFLINKNFLCLIMNINNSIFNIFILIID